MDLRTTVFHSWGTAHLNLPSAIRLPRSSVGEKGRPFFYLRLVVIFKWLRWPPSSPFSPSLGELGSVTEVFLHWAQLILWISPVPLLVVMYLHQFKVTVTFGLKQALWGQYSINSGFLPFFQILLPCPGTDINSRAWTAGIVPRIALSIDPPCPDRTLCSINTVQSTNCLSVSALGG